MPRESLARFLGQLLWLFMRGPLLFAPKQLIFGGGFVAMRADQGLYVLGEYRASTVGRDTDRNLSQAFFTVSTLPTLCKLPVLVRALLEEWHLFWSYSLFLPSHADQIH